MAWEHKGFTIQMWRLGSSPLSPCSTTLVGMYAMFLHYSSTFSNVFRVYNAKLCTIHTQLFLSFQGALFFFILHTRRILPLFWHLDAQNFILIKFRVSSPQMPRKLSWDLSSTCSTISQTILHVIISGLLCTFFWKYFCSKASSRQREWLGGTDITFFDIIRAYIMRILPFSGTSRLLGI